MGRYYYEDGREPWRPDDILVRFLGRDRKGTLKHAGGREPFVKGRSRSENRKSADRDKKRALDLGAGYGRNTLWLAEQGFQVEAWETDRRYGAEARREAKRRDVKIYFRNGDFTRRDWRGPYEVIVLSCVLHLMRRSAGLRVLRAARKALGEGGRLFLLVKLTRDRYFQRWKRDPDWEPVAGEKNTLRRVDEGGARPQPHLRPGYGGQAGRHLERVRWRGRIQSALAPSELKAALRGLRVRHYREVVLRSDWETPEQVTHHVAEVVAEKPKFETRK